MAQMKRQIITQKKKELNKMEVSNLPDTKFKTLITRILRVLSEDVNSIKRSLRNEGYTN